jgi:ankyrin repeat protein
VESLQVLLESGANPNVNNAITGATPLHCAVQSSKATSADRRILTIQTLLAAGSDPSLGDFFGSIPLDYCEDDDDNDVDAKELLRPEIPPVFTAIQELNMEELQRLLKDNAEVVQSRHADITPLLQLVNDMLEEQHTDGGHDVYLEMMQLLLENGADPNAKPAAKRNGHLNIQQDPGDAPLHKICLALYNAHRAAAGEAEAAAADRVIDRLQRAARLLKEYNALVSPSTEQLLHDAARRNQLTMIHFLIQDLAISPHVQGRQGMTPLQFAARSGQTETVEFLLAQDNINIEIQDEHGHTALDAARLNNKDNIVALLEQHTKTP